MFDLSAVLHFGSNDLFNIMWMDRLCFVVEVPNLTHTRVLQEAEGQAGWNPLP